MDGSGYISRIVKVGNIPMGGDYPIRIQSMTTTNTLDTAATVNQAIRLIEAGCEYVRLTAQGTREAENLKVIKNELHKQGYKTPLIADIHYNPRAAEIAAKYVEKVRINPGNYTDRKHGKVSYNDEEYAQELVKIKERISPLIGICRQHGTVIRIGSNHGSLSERIMLKYGDTPAGMVESVLEFVRICRDLDFNDLVLSMKASNVKVMIQANRLLVKRMIEEGMNYPIHLGVTEAGDAEDGRIKSAAGIGTLLAEGIGDTIRVSLTEDPEFEIPEAKRIVEKYNEDDHRKTVSKFRNYLVNPFQYIRRKTIAADRAGNEQVPVVIVSGNSKQLGSETFEKEFVPDYLFDSQTKTFRSFSQEGEIYTDKDTVIKPIWIKNIKEINDLSWRDSANELIVIDTDQSQSLDSVNEMMGLMIKKGIDLPVVLGRDYTGLAEDQLLTRASVDFSYFLTDGLIDGIWIKHSGIDLKKICYLAYGILQATGSRISKTEYIACPSCGRTLFNIQETLKKIKSRTSHLKGLKIGVMGCCVNGPGEMADAHYGYVGAGSGKISLYKGKQVIRAGIPENEAVESLISLIKLNGDWK